MRLCFSFCFCSAVALSAISSHGALSLHTTESAFTTAAQAAGTVEFTDNLDTGSKVGSTITRTDVVISGNAIAAFPNSNLTNTIDGTGYLRFQVNESRPVTFTFDSAVIAFGFQVNPRSQGVGHTFTAATGDANITFSMPTTDTTEFRGFISDTPFTTFTISDAGSANDIYGIDNLVAYTAVPEPEACALGSGALLFLFARRKRSAREKTEP